MSKLKAGILIVSDTASKDPTSDGSEKPLREAFEVHGGDKWNVVETKIVPDSFQEIQSAVMLWADSESFLNLIITTGGTGFAAKDNTPEAVSPLINRHAPGLVHGMLSASLAVTPFALMARPVAGVRKKTLVLTLPGSPKGAVENLQAVLKLLPHACVQAAGGDSRSQHAGGVKKLEQDAGVSQSSASKNVASHSHTHNHGHTHGHGHSHGAGGHVIPKAHTDPASRPKSNDPNAGPTRRYRESPYPMLSVVDALELIEKNTPSPSTVKVPVNTDLVGQILAEDVTAQEPVPAFRASIVDGYAVIVPEGGTNSKGVFSISSISHATPGETKPLGHGQITRITTGAPLPPEATAVVMVEDTELKSMTEDGSEEREIEILTDKVKHGENVRQIGSDTKEGEVILRKGQQVTAAGGELGLLASVGAATVTVYKKPRLGVLSTGDEIVQHDKPGKLRYGEVRDCNRLTLLSTIRGWGFEAVDLGIASDKPGSLEEALREAMRAVDVIITSGGVSMGELDLLKPTIERSLGGTIHFGRVNMKPGKPTTFATIPMKDNKGERTTKLIFSLPGNPASAVVTFLVFALPSLHSACGVEPQGLAVVSVVCEHDIRGDAKRPEYHRVFVSAGKDGLLHATSTGMQRSSRIGSFSGANALLCLEATERPYTKGQKVDALLMGRISGF